MKKEIVYTDKYAIILNDEFIKKCYDWNNFELSDFSESMDVILAHLPLSNAPILEGLPLLPSLLQGEEKYKYTEEDVKIAIQQAFLSGVERLEDFEKVEKMTLEKIT